MLDALLTHINQQKLLVETDRVLIGVSGGVDSMVLAHLMSGTAWPIGIVHVNYNLRGSDSLEDQKLVEVWCKTQDIPFYLRNVEPDEFQSSGSVQMVAREIRYNFFQQLLEGENFTKVFTAHNANDNLETVIYNLAKGTGMSGLVGIAPVKGNVVRPMLPFSREQVEAYARANSIEWREDLSNQKNDYSRNLIRNEVLPQLEKINPGLIGTSLDSLIRLRGSHQLIEKLVREYTRLEESDSGKTLSLGWFTGSEADLVVLDELLKTFGFNFADIKDLHQAILTRSTGSTFLSSSHIINLDRNQLIISPLDEMGVEPVHEVIDQGQQIVQIGEWTFELSTVQGNNIKESPSPGSVLMDYDKVTFPIVLRTWKEGDWFIPLGMSGKKKVSDFMIDSKIPVTLKPKVLVMESNERIIWLVNYRLDDRVKVTSETSRMLKIETSKHV